MKIANYSLLAEFARAANQSIYALIGGLAMTIADQQDQSDLPWNIVAIGIAIRWGLIIAALLIMFKSILAWKLRRELIATQALVLGETAEIDVTGQLTVTPNANGTTVVATLEGHDEQKDDEG